MPKSVKQNGFTQFLLDVRYDVFVPDDLSNLDLYVIP